MYTLLFSKPHIMLCQWVIHVHPVIQQTPHYVVSMGDSCTPCYSANPTLCCVNGWFMYTLLFSKPHTMLCQWVIHVHPIIQQTPHYEVSMGDSCRPYHSANLTLCSVNGWFMYTLLFRKPHTMKCQWVIRVHPIIQQTPHYVVSMGDSCTPYYSANPTLWSVNGWFVYTLSFSKPHIMKCQWVIHVHPIIQQTPHYEVSMGDSCTPYHSANLTLCSVNGWFVYTLLFSKPHIMKCQWVIHVHPIIQQTPHYKVSMGDSCTPYHSANPTL